MANTLNITNAGLSDQSNIVTDFQGTPRDTDGATGQDETYYQNPNWAKQWGYFNDFPDLKSAIIAKAVWNIGKGWTADPEVTTILENIKGWGKDTFDDILYNMEIIKRVGGDAFAEIIRSADGTIINLKPLDPSSIRIVVDKRGIIKRYEQVNKLPNGTKEIIKFELDEIFHLSNNRLADQIHGISDIDSIEAGLLADGESFTDTKKIMHRQAKPLIMFKVGTDDPTKLNAFISKMDQATQKGENIYIPDDANSISYEVVQINVSPMVMAWRDELRKRFYRVIGLPELLPSGGGDATESGGKIGYLSWEQVVEKEQRFLEMQIYNQLYIKINLIPPATLSMDLQKDNSKDGQGFQPNDTEAGVGQ